MTIETKNHHVNPIPQPHHRHTYNTTINRNPDRQVAPLPRARISHLFFLSILQQQRNTAQTPLPRLKSIPYPLPFPLFFPLPFAPFLSVCCFPYIIHKFYVPPGSVMQKRPQTHRSHLFSRRSFFFFFFSFGEKKIKIFLICGSTSINHPEEAKGEGKVKRERTRLLVKEAVRGRFFFGGGEPGGRDRDGMRVIDCTYVAQFPYLGVTLIQQICDMMN